MRLDDGTVIFVIYDTILVAATSEKRAAQWGARIEKNMALAQLKLKYAKYGRTAQFGGVDIKSTNDGFDQLRLDQAIARFLAVDRQPAHDTDLELMLHKFFP